MIKVIEINPTKNDDIVKIGFEQVLDEFEQARAFSKAKRAWLIASVNHKFKVGDTFNKNIEMRAFDNPQYEGHEPFEKTGKYYTGEIV